MKEFFIISNIYRTMHNKLKTKLKDNNIPINETQLNILYILYGKEEELNSDELLKVGGFALSNLLFNINSLQGNQLLEGQDSITRYNLKEPLDLSENGKKLLEKIDKIFANVYKKEKIDLLENLTNYEREILESLK